MSHSAHGAVVGVNDGGAQGVFGQATAANGVGVVGEATASGTGVFGHCSNGLAMHAVADQGIALLAEAKGPPGSIAGQFNGDVVVTGDIRLSNQDCAEDFDVSDIDSIEPGSVMVIEKEGALHMSAQAYDKRVAGVVSGAGDLRPGIILGGQRSLQERKPIALLGKVCCKVDAQYAAIEVGDLLTSSPTPGHAMKAVDPQKAFGAAIGKALRPLRDGQGLIPILIALQ